MSKYQTDPGSYEEVGFIGLGAMGGAIARNLAKGGVPLTVFDLNADLVADFVERGSRGADSLADFEGSKVVILCLPGPNEFEAALFGEGGLGGSLAPGDLVIDMTTNHPRVVERAAKRLEERGVEFVDAPVAGGKVGGEAGTLTIAIGGSADSFERAKPILAFTSSTIIHAGAVGSGNVCKLVHNMGIHIVRQTLAEIFTLGVKAGVSPAVLTEFVGKGAFGQLDQLHVGLPSRVLTGEFIDGEPSFRHVLALKDIRLVNDLADGLGVPLPLGRECLELARTASDEGWNERDAWATFALQEQRAGVEVRS
ncbi:NAD(P)-dependent oxidoreductase [Saccharomonospora sp. NPDC046836]|uniref:NAD(P)-dependent oxidoreductase n=1 Tax=Saccharomonospora sp. NPDC046836 TaxID=3156921 RepID=UPI0033CF73A5